MHLIRFAGLSMLVMLGMMPARAAPAPDHWLATLNAVWGGTWAIEKKQFMFSSFDNEENWSDGTVSEPSDLPVFTPAWKKIYDHDRA